MLVGERAHGVDKLGLQHIALMIPIFVRRVLQHDVHRLARVVHSVIKPAHSRFQKTLSPIRLRRRYLFACEICQPKAWHAVFGGIPQRNLKAQPPQRVRLIGLEYGENIHLPLSENARIEPNAHLIHKIPVHLLRLQDGEIIRRLRELIPESLAFPVFGRIDAAVLQRHKALLPALPEQRESHQRQPRLCPAPQQIRGVRGGIVHIPRHQQLHMLPAGGVPNIHRQPLLPKKPLFLRHIRRHIRQVRLRLIPHHKHHLIRLAWRACCCGECDKRGCERQEG